MFRPLSLACLLDDIRMRNPFVERRTVALPVIGRSL